MCFEFEALNVTAGKIIYYWKTKASDVFRLKSIFWQCNKSTKMFWNFSK